MYKNHAVSSRAALASRALARLGALILIGFIVGCGGGGGGGGGAPSAGGGAPGALVYTGNTNAAVITTTNAAQLLANVVGGDDTSAAISSAGPTQSGGAIELGRRLTRNVRATPILHGSAGRSTSAVIDSTEPCAGGGTARVTGVVSDTTGTGTLTVTWTNCVSGDDTLNGTATLRVDAFDLTFFEITDSTFTFERLTLSGPAGTSVASGSVRTQLSIAGRSETVTTNLVTLSASGRLTKTENLTFTAIYDNIFAPVSFVESVSGRVFDGTHGFVDVATPTPFVFSTLSQAFPSSGQMVLTGANSARVRATAFSSRAVTLELDLDGNSSFERTATLAWTDLGTPAAADLGDTDGDGMHNSWETTNGLSATDAGDALLDRDGDSANNLAEYLAGSDPNLAGSTPTSLPPAPPPSGGPLPPSTTPPPGPVADPPAPAPESGPLPTPIAARSVGLIGVSDIVYDPTSQRIYAALRGNPGRIVPINPATGATEPAITVGIDPVKLALSDNGQFLYVGLAGQSDFQRITLSTGTVTTFPLDSPQFPGCGNLFVEDMEVLPGNPQSVAISRRNGGCSPRHEGVAIYDNGTRRTTATPGHTGANRIEFSASADLLYGYNNETTEFGFRRMQVNASGVSVIDVFDSFEGNLISGFGVDIRFGHGRIYTTTGKAIDPVALTTVATFGLPGFGSLVVPDTAVDRVIFLSFDGTTGRWSLRSFDMASSPPTRRGREDISNIVGQPASLIRWGTRGLAFLTAGGVLLVESANLIP